MCQHRTADRASKPDRVRGESASLPYDTMAYDLRADVTLLDTSLHVR